MVAPIIFFVFIFSFSSLSSQASDSNVSHNRFDVRFPFRVFIQDSGKSNFSGFDLVYKENSSFIHFPSIGDLVVKSIFYDVRRIDLLDPNNCVHGVFLNLDLSLTPFQYYYVVKNYTYLNCSTRLLLPNVSEIPCLSGANHHVYTVEAGYTAPDSCRVLKTVAIPFSYSPYLGDSSFGLGLTWNLTPCDRDCEANGGRCEFLSETGSQTGCIKQERDEVLSIDEMSERVLRDVRAMFFQMMFYIFLVTAYLNALHNISRQEGESSDVN